MEEVLGHGPAIPLAVVRSKFDCPDRAEEPLRWNSIRSASLTAAHPASKIVSSLIIGI
jgi:hypothetical protein